MLKQFSDMFARRGLTVDEQTGHAHGVVKGYEVNVSLDDVRALVPVKVTISGKVPQDMTIKFDSAAKMAGIRRSKVNILAWGVEIQIGPEYRNLDDLVSQTDLVIDKVISVMTKAEIPGADACPVCGQKLEDAPSSEHKIGENQVTLHDECVEKLANTLHEEEERFKLAPGHYGRGFLGALIGTLAGATVAIALYAVGFIAGWSSFIAAFLGFKLYIKFGGKKDKKMIVIVASTVIVGMLLAILGCYAVGIAMLAFRANISFADAVRSCLSDSQFVISLVVNLVLVLVFSIIGMVEEVIRRAKALHREDLIK